MKRIDIQPNTSEWLSWRNGGIGSSDIAKIMGVSPFGTALDVYNTKAGFSEEKKKTKAMQRGIDYEPQARRKFCQLVGRSFDPAMYERIDLPFVKSSLDGYNEEFSEVLEIKVPGKKDLNMAAMGEVPVYYNYQMQWQMFTVDAIRGYFVCYNPDTDEMYTVTVRRDSDLIEEMKIAATKFWEDLLIGMPPPSTQDDVEYIDNEELTQLIIDAKLIKHELNRWEGAWDDVKSKILGFSNGRSFKSHDLTVSKTNGRKTYDVDRMASEGINVDQYATPGKEFYTVKINK